MAQKLYKVFNGPAPTTASQAAVTTGTAIKTMLQLSTPSTRGISLVDWGYSFDGSAAAAGIEVEIFSTSVAATVTAFAAADVTKLSAPTAEATVLTLGTGNSGYTASAEGTPANVDMFDAQFCQPTNYYAYQWPQDREPAVDVSLFVRIRVKAAAAVNMICWVSWYE